MEIKINSGMDVVMQIPSYNESTNGHSHARKKQIKELMLILNKYAGFRATENLETKLVKVLRNVNDQELTQWIIQLARGNSFTDINSLVEDLTNHETYFFRDENQFRVLTEKILPNEFLENKGRRKFRIWSAASASGEEAYTLAILVAEFALLKGLAKWTVNREIEFASGFSVEIFGSDISRQAIRLAKDGVYTNFGLSSFRNMPEQYWKYFNKQESVKSERHTQNFEYFTPINSIKKIVSFDQHNLVDASVSKFGKFDLIVCRNLFIYIDEGNQEKIQKNFYEAGLTGSSLILSAVDRLHDKKRYKEHWYKNSIYYERKS